MLVETLMDIMYPAMSRIGLAAAPSIAHGRPGQGPEVKQRNSRIPSPTPDRVVRVMEVEVVVGSSPNSINLFTPLLLNPQLPKPASRLTRRLQQIQPLLLD